jgi:hypothetical protein
MNFTDFSDFVVAAVFHMVDLAVFLKAKGRPSEVLFKFNPKVGSRRKVHNWSCIFV